jgi:hypothetical protein
MSTELKHRDSRRLRVNKLNENLKSISESIAEIPAPEPAYESVASLPSSIPEGKILLFNGMLWRGLEAGESSLAAGTPWPVKGFKELALIFSQGGTTINLVNTYINDFGIAPASLTRSSAGIYLLQINITKHNDYHAYVVPNHIGSRGMFTCVNMSAGYTFMAFEIYFRNYSGSSTDYGSFATQATFIIREYPPPA